MYRSCIVSKIWCIDPALIFTLGNVKDCSRCSQGLNHRCPQFVLWWGRHRCSSLRYNSRCKWWPNRRPPTQCRPPSAMTLRRESSSHSNWSSCCMLTSALRGTLTSQMTWVCSIFIYFDFVVQQVCCYIYNKSNKSNKSSQVLAGLWEKIYIVEKCSHWYT